MNVIPLMIFISLALVTLAVIFFAFMVKEHTFEHSDRMALMPLLDDDPKPKGECDSSDSNQNGPMSADVDGQSNME